MSTYAKIPIVKKETKKEKEIINLVSRISPVDSGAMEEAKKRQDYRVKVPGSLGRLEEISIRLAGITGKPYGNEVRNQAIILMCGDNGVVEEGVASAPQTVTLMQTINFTKKITGVGTQAEYFGIDILPIDVGLKLPIPEEYLTDEMGFTSKVVNRRIANGTKNLAKEPAMSREEAIRAILIGAEAAEACKAAGKNLIGVGEMGIGNTTTATAIIAGIALGKDPGRRVEDLVGDIVGRGGGLDDQGLAKKKQVIEEALIRYREIYSAADSTEGTETPGILGLDPIELLRCVGGFDIAAMTGAYLGAAANRLPAVVDGVISIAAALIAVEICPLVKDYIFTSHKSREGGYALAADLLGISPMYDLDMRLGEGSGCPIAFKIIEAATAVINNMKSLDEAQVDGGYLDQFREEGQFK